MRENIANNPLTESAETPVETELENPSNIEPSAPDAAKKGKKGKLDKRERGRPKGAKSKTTLVDAPETVPRRKEVEEISDTRKAMQSRGGELNALLVRHHEKNPESKLGFRLLPSGQIEVAEITEPAPLSQAIPPEICSAVVGALVSSAIVGTRAAKGAPAMPPRLPQKQLADCGVALSAASVYLPVSADYEKIGVLIAAAVATLPMVGLVIAEWKQPGVLGDAPLQVVPTVNAVVSEEGEV